MVTVRNDSELTSAVLRVRSGGNSAQQELALPARGHEKNFFVDLPALAATINVSLDALPLNGRLHLRPARSSVPATTTAATNEPRASLNG